MRCRIQHLTLILLFAFIISACQEEKVPEPFNPRNDHEAYQKALESANLLETALGKEWTTLAQEALEQPEQIQLPYEEAFYIDDRSAYALGYHFDAKRGQKIQITIEDIAPDSIDLFIDLYRIEESSFTHIASADRDSRILGFEPRRDAQYVLRFQSELLRGGTFKITFESVPSLVFPVAGKTHRSIGSIWGDVRDGGKRSHEGVDIFAPRGTPVIAPVDGVVRAADERGIGGKVVWLEDNEHSQNLYFAHLNDWNVKKGDRVKTGDTLGFVGNTGNARTTPPHLHFGIYSRGAMNPINHLKPLGRALKTVDEGFEWLGQEVRLRNNSTLYSDLNKKKSSTKLSKYQVAKVLSLNSDNCRVQLPDGKIGYISKRDLTSQLSALDNLVADFDMELMLKPDFKTSVNILKAQESFDVIGKDKEFYFIETSTGKRGWIHATNSAATSQSEENPND